MKLNMPISGDNTVLFTPTLFALVRTSLGMTTHENDFFRDSCFRKIIKRTWPNLTQKTLDLLIPEQTGMYWVNTTVATTVSVIHNLKTYLSFITLLFMFYCMKFPSQNCLYCGQNRQKTV